jgi:hypothetical protein
VDDNERNELQRISGLCLAQAEIDDEDSPDFGFTATCAESPGHEGPHRMRIPRAFFIDADGATVPPDWDPVYVVPA